LVSNPFLTREKVLSKIDLVRSSSKNLLFLGSLDDNKNILKTIDIFSIISDKEPNVNLTIVGTGSLEKEVLLKTKEKKKIKFVGFSEDIAHYLKNSDFLLLPSKFDSHPSVVLESMVSRVIPITSSQVGTNYLVKDKDFIIDLKSSDKDIADKIIQLMKKDNKYLNRLREEHRKIAMNYTKEAKINEFKESFDRCLKEMGF